MSENFIFPKSPESRKDKIGMNKETEPIFDPKKMEEQEKNTLDRFRGDKLAAVFMITSSLVLESGRNFEKKEKLK